MLSKREQEYIEQNYFRKSNWIDYDITTIIACEDILDKIKQTSNVIFDPFKQAFFVRQITDQECRQLARQCCRDKELRHRDSTVQRCLKVMRKDLFLIRGDVLKINKTKNVVVKVIKKK